MFLAAYYPHLRYRYLLIEDVRQAAIGSTLHSHTIPTPFNGRYEASSLHLEVHSTHIQYRQLLTGDLRQALCNWKHNPFTSKTGSFNSRCEASSLQLAAYSPHIKYQYQLTANVRQAFCKWQCTVFHSLQYPLTAKIGRVFSIKKARNLQKEKCDICRHFRVILPAKNLVALSF